MIARRFALLAATVAFLAAGSATAQDARSAYTYVRETNGDVLVISPTNGEVQARRNLPITVGDEMEPKTRPAPRWRSPTATSCTSEGARRSALSPVSAQQGSSDEVSAIDLSEGSVILSVLGSEDRAIPRVDTADATVYAGSGARVRVNADVRRGSSVVVRAGSVEVRNARGLVHGASGQLPPRPG